MYEGGGLGPPPLTQSGSGEALDEVVPLDLMAGFFFLGAMVPVSSASMVDEGGKTHTSKAASQVCGFLCSLRGQIGDF